MIRRAGKPTEFSPDQIIEEIEQKLQDKNKYNFKNKKLISQKEKDIIEWVLKKSLVGKLLSKIRQSKQQKKKVAMLNLHH